MKGREGEGKSIKKGIHGDSERCEEAVDKKVNGNERKGRERKTNKKGT